MTTCGVVAFGATLTVMVIDGQLWQPPVDRSAWPQIRPETIPFQS